jgi:FlaA1/EpsC-like NDP-sugar epimerase
VKITFTGLRPGEKLFEELLANNETTLPTSHSKLRVMKSVDVPNVKWLEDLDTWLAVPVRSEDEAKRGLKLRVPEYQQMVC